MTTTVFHHDQSDQGSVDSDYTSYVSSKVNPSSATGSNSSLNRPTRSISIESAGHHRIPTRHVNRSQSTRDPLQFVKLQATQEPSPPAERRKPLERRQSATNDDEQNDWSKVKVQRRATGEEKQLSLNRFLSTSDEKRREKHQTFFPPLLHLSMASLNALCKSSM